MEKLGIDVDEKKKFVIMGLIGKGSFGSVVKLWDPSKGVHVAAKIQLVRKGSKIDKEFEIMKSLEILKIQGHSPCVLSAFRCIRTDSIGNDLSKVSNISQYVPEHEEFTYQITEMDLVSGCNLREFSRAHEILRSPISLEETKGIIFQLFWINR